MRSCACLSRYHALLLNAFPPTLSFRPPPRLSPLFLLLHCSPHLTSTRSSSSPSSSRLIMGSGRAHERSQSTLPLLPYADSPPATPLPFNLKPRANFIPAPRRRFILVTCAFLSVIGLLGLAATSISRSSSDSGYVVSDRPESNTTGHPTYPALDPEDVADPSIPPMHEDGRPLAELAEPTYSPYLRGPPTDSFRDNLRNDTKYVTSWISAGWGTL